MSDVADPAASPPGAPVRATQGVAGAGTSPPPAAAATPPPDAGSPGAGGPRGAGRAPGRVADAASFADELDTLIRARHPLLYVQTSEERRFDTLVAELALRRQKALYTWSIASGFRRVDPAAVRAGKAVPAGDDARDPLEALERVMQLSGGSLVTLKDFHPFLNDPTVVRRVRELGFHLEGTHTTVLFSSPVLNLPAELEKQLTVLDLPLPTFAELFALLQDICRVVHAERKAEVRLTRAEAETVARAAQGLTFSEAENAFARAVVSDGVVDVSDARVVLGEKRQVIRKSGLLEYIGECEPLGDVGGLDALKAWLARRNRAFTGAARSFGLPEPKGLLLLGVQGCGKSLVAKSVAGVWGVPLLRLDMGRIFGSLVGASEDNMRRALRTAESVAPVVLWLDEIEKGLAGVQSSGNSDAGTTARVFGTFLTWMQDKDAAVFVVATANRIDMLPPELLRKGRFDEIFFVDLPSAAERADILAIHLRKRRRDPARFPLVELAAATDGFSGAELEQVVVAALYDAFADGRDIDGADLARAARASVPLSTTMREEIGALRLWARTRARPATEPVAGPPREGGPVLATELGRFRALAGADTAGATPARGVEDVFAPDGAGGASS